MKKSLLFTAAALMALSSFAETWKAETVFNYGVDKDGVSNPIPDIDGGIVSLGYWSAGQKTDPNLVCNQSNARFAVGLNGKIFTIDDKTNAIVAIDANGTKKYVDIPSRAAGKWNGTAISSDDAGNIVYNYCFTDPVKSITMWGVVDASTKTVTDVTMSDEAFAALKINVTAGKATRLDCLGHIVGDVRKEAYAFATFMNSQTIALLTFKGDGTKTTSLTATTAQDVVFMTKSNDGAANTSAVPSTSFEDFTKSGVIPQNHRYYAPVGVVGNMIVGVCPSMTDGYVCKWYDVDGAEKWSIGDNPMGNRDYKGIATFELGGKRYIVRNYVDADRAGLFDQWKSVMTFGIFEAETGNCVASWMDSYFNNGNTGMGSLSAEVVNENTVNVYTYVATSVASTAPVLTDAGCYGAMVKFTVSDEEPVAPVELAGKGTEAEPYLIGTAADLCVAHLYIPQETCPDYIYFKQTADIDMAGVNSEDWQALNGWYGKYAGKFIYDGDNHVIRNFKGIDKTEGGEGEECNYYDSSIFGVVRGTVMNLGVIDAYSEETGNFEGAGILSCYSGQSEEIAVYDNVFVTGKVKGNKRTGGMLAHAGANNELSQVYAVVEVNGGSNETGGIVGKLNGKTMMLNEGYVAAKLTSTGSKGLVAAGTGALDVQDFMAVGTDAVAAEGITGAEDVSKFESASADFLRAIGDYSFFLEGKELETNTTFGKMPTFDWMTNSQITGEEGPVELAGKGTEAEPYLIGTAADLCAAHLYIPQETCPDYIYFKQTADIDMAGVNSEDWQALNGWYGKYAGKFIYDGDNHVIRNFKGIDKTEGGEGEECNYYDSSIFGVVRGTVMNLGVVDASSEETGNFEGAGILSCYSGQSEEIAVYDNVFVTGKVKGNKRTGGMLAHAGANNELSQVYAVVEVNGGSNETGGIVGKLNGKTMMLNEGYVAAKLTSTGSKGLIAGGTGALDVQDFMAVGTDAVAAEGITGAEGISKFESASADFLRAVLDYSFFFDGKELETNTVFGKMPTFDWMTADQISAVDDVVVDENEANAPAVYYNLQGVEVANPQNGLYIKKQGNKVSKVVIR